MLLLLFACPLAGRDAASALALHDYYGLKASGLTAAAAAVAAAASPQEALLDQASIWVKTLSEQEAFSSWKEAKLQAQALGPGTHGWLITLKDANDKPVGYLIAYAAPDHTYQLGEYGIGEQPLFDQASLKRSLLANGLIASLSDTSYRAAMQYVHPFVAVWKVVIGSDTYWLDAKSDELLPLDAASWDSLARESSILSESSLSSYDRSEIHAKRLLLNKSFDPYDRLPWLQNEKPFDVSDEGAFVKRLTANRPLRYVSEPYGDKMLYALPVVGYMEWSGQRLDAAIDMNGIRFIPLPQLKRHGFFYE